MTTNRPNEVLRRVRAASTGAGFALLAATLALSIGTSLGIVPAAAQGTSPAPSAQVRSPASPPRLAVSTDESLRWQKLKPAQREALKPLQQEWPNLDAPSREKWIELAARMPNLPASERTRIQERMTDWARLTPAERGQARLRYQEAKQVPPSDRRSRWAAYQALPPEQKNELAARAAAARTPVPANGRVDTATAGRADRLDRSGRDGPQAKSNIVPNPAYAAPPRPIGPTVMQAAPGATTTLITRRPAPPPHQHTGLPKIAATPEFVNKSTLLPQRGPQGAAIRPAAASEPAARR
ncbi:MAG: DUF3106 domain-containing protein [Caldimonas sp.]